MVRKWGFVINPAAGGGRGEETAPEVYRQVQRLGIKAEIVKTSKPRHAELLSAMLAEGGCNPVVAVGGDGTINEVVNGIVNKGVTLGVVPAGSGNDFIHLLGFPENYTDQHWQVLTRAETRRIDIGVCNGRYFINGMGFGFDAHIASEVARGRSRRSYMLSVLKNLFLYRAPEVVSTVDGSTERRRCFLKTIGIGRRFGGGFLLTAKALPDDGLFDICTADELPLLHRLRLLLKVRRGTHVDCKGVKYYRVASSITLQCNTEMPYHLDGEVLFAHRFEIQILPSAIDVIINPFGRHCFS
jgi:YegS/Rv2252/BmrU family lipid kinase